MKNIKLITEYDGSEYCGWQIQKDFKTVQGEIQEAIYKLTGECSGVNGCSRTDSGVHAYGHVSNFHIASTIPANKFCYALNSILPNDIVVKMSLEVDHDFHARFSCLGKRYLYKIYNYSTRSALLYKRLWFEPRKLNVNEMEKAAGFFKGEFDFTAFQAVGSDNGQPVKRIFDSCVYTKPCINGGQEIFFEVAGTGFLYNMVRIMTGTLVDVGIGKISADDIPGIISSLDRKRAGSTAPPHGLYLLEAYYDESSMNII